MVETLQQMLPLHSHLACTATAGKQMLSPHHIPPANTSPCRHSCAPSIKATPDAVGPTTQSPCGRHQPVIGWTLLVAIKCHWDMA